MMEMLSDGLFIVDAGVYNATGLLLVATGMLVSIRFLGFPDLTADGSFTIGAGVYAACTSSGNGLLISLGAAVLAGMAAGAGTACLNRAFKLGRIISSVIVMILLVTAAPYLTGGGTIGLLDSGGSLADLQTWDQKLTRRMLPGASFSLHIGFIILFWLLGIAVTVGCILFFRGHRGIEIRYLGSARTPHLLSERKRTLLTLLGLAIGNGAIGLGGAVEAVRRGGFSQNMGLGIMLVGLAGIILGESLLKSYLRRDNLRVTEYCLAATGGTILYSFILQLLLALGLTFLDIRITTTLFLLVALAVAAKYHPNTARLF